MVRRSFNLVAAADEIRVGAGIEDVFLLFVVSRFRTKCDTHLVVSMDKDLVWVY